MMHTKQWLLKSLNKSAVKLRKSGRDLRWLLPTESVNLDITDVAVVIAVSTPHRADAYEANRYAIERIKEIVPIWKKEHWEDGEEWIGNQKETSPIQVENQRRVIYMNKILFFAHLRDAVGQESIEY